jgi:radical SAM/Cys-rich protein
MKTLKALEHELSFPLVQIETLDRSRSVVLPFDEKLAEFELAPLMPTGLDVLQVNVGKMCNQTCAHCHVDAGPDRTEIMTRSTMEQCLQALERSGIETVDITGGAPEMNPHFRWFVEEIRKLGRSVMVRSNLTILTVNRKYRELPGFFAEQAVAVISSLPCYTVSNTNRQRGDGVFERSIEALRMLNQVGYGQENSGLILNLVYNPLGAFLPGAQAQLEADYKRVLAQEYGVAFNELFCITNMPISRFLDYLLQEGEYERYMETLVNAFNPEAARGVMCRNLLSVGWDGKLYDCDFNQMLDLGIEETAPGHICEFDESQLRRRRVVTHQHCYGCTAGAGSSCGGEISAQARNA